MEPLDAARIDVPGAEVRVLARCSSTNSVLLADVNGGCVLLAAETQSAGRGQRGRRWHSAPGRDLTFSLARHMAQPARELAALPLVAGVAAASALRALGVPAALKWPNDLVVAGAKLGGILVETRAEGRGTRVVIGIGINGAHRPALARRVRRPVAALGQFIAASRNGVIGALARSLLAALQRFEADGFAELRRQWESLDAHAGQRLRVRLADGRSIRGIGCGVADDGALRVLTRGGERAVRSGRIVAAALSRRVA